MNRYVVLILLLLIPPMAKTTLRAVYRLAVGAVKGLQAR